jgi:hypothetical protein
MALGWVLVVVAVAAVTFVVVDRAGRGVGQASAARTLAAVPTSEVTAPPTGSPRPGPTSTSGPTSSREQGGTGASVPPLRDAPRTVAFTTRGGTVVVTCEGSELRLGSITPRDGWRFAHEVEHGGLEVHLSAAGDEVELVVRCDGGVPARVEG